ncbi:hypothetical protein NW823_13315, partial [Synechococcus sp. R55.1]
LAVLSVFGKGFLEFKLQVPQSKAKSIIKPIDRSSLLKIFLSWILSWLNNVSNSDLFLRD